MRRQLGAIEHTKPEPKARHPASTADQDPCRRAPGFLDCFCRRDHRRRRNVAALVAMVDGRKLKLDAERLIYHRTYARG